MQTKRGEELSLALRDTGKTKRVYESTYDVGARGSDENRTDSGDVTLHSRSRGPQGKMTPGAEVLGLKVEVWVVHRSDGRRGAQSPPFTRHNTNYTHSVSDSSVHLKGHDLSLTTPSGRGLR